MLMALFFQVAISLRDLVIFVVENFKARIQESRRLCKTLFSWYIECTSKMNACCAHLVGWLGATFFAFANHTFESFYLRICHYQKWHFTHGVQIFLVERIINVLLTRSYDIESNAWIKTRSDAISDLHVLNQEDCGLSDLYLSSWFIYLLVIDSEKRWLFWPKGCAKAECRISPIDGS